MDGGNISGGNTVNNSTVTKINHRLPKIIIKLLLLNIWELYLQQYLLQKGNFTIQAGADTVDIWCKIFIQTTSNHFYSKFEIYVCNNMIKLKKNVNGGHLVFRMRPKFMSGINICKFGEIFLYLVNGKKVFW